MKQFLHWLAGRSTHHILIGAAIAIGCFTSCWKSEKALRNPLGPSSFSSDVLDKWFTLEIRLYKDATGITNSGFARPFAYSGICAYESTDPGPSSWKHKYNGLTGLPESDKGGGFFLPASVNASLAEFNRSFFTPANLNPTDLAAIDSLEKAIRSSFGMLEADLVFGDLAIPRTLFWRVPGRRAT